MDIILIKNELLQSATYLLDEYLVDCGDSEKICNALGTRKLKGIFLTHCHHDHVYGIDKVLQRYPQTKIYCSQKTYEGLTNPMLNLSYIMPDYSFTFDKDDNVKILDDWIHYIDGIKVEVISTIGHSEDCISLIIENNIFTGDAHIPFAKIFTKWPTSNRIQAFESEQKLIDIAAERNLIIRPGHWQ